MSEACSRLESTQPSKSASCFHSNSLRAPSGLARGLRYSAVYGQPRAEYADSLHSLRMPVIPPRISTVDSWRNPLLEDVLRGIMPQSGIAYWPEFRAPWGVSFKRDWAVFHIIAQGTCWLQVKGVAGPLELSAGDFAVVTGGQYHTMRDLPSSPVAQFRRYCQDAGARQEGGSAFRR